MSGFPPTDLICPVPGDCPIRPFTPIPLRRCVVPAGGAWFRCYDGKFGYDEPNPGYGDTRFAPFDDASTGERVPTLYLAGSEIAALLETVFHEVQSYAPRLIYQSQLIGRILAQVTVPQDLTLIDLRDPELESLLIRRDELVSTPAEHYPCTRRWAQAIHQESVDGMIWNSRQAEILVGTRDEVMIVFADHYRTVRGGWKLARPGLQALFDGPGRDRVEQIADDLEALIETD